MLNEAQQAQYEEDGFVVIPDFFDASRLAPVMAEVEGIVESVAQRLVAAGKLTETFADAPLQNRLTKLEAAWPGAAVLVHIRGILEPALADLWSDAKLLDAVQQVLGPNVSGHPVWNLRSKTPDHALTTVPWHQDCAYLEAESENTLQPTAWIPLCNATHEMGCLQVVRGGHKHGVCRHQLENTVGDAQSWYLYIDEKDLPEGEIVTCEVPLGGILLINQLIPHRSTNNLSDAIRWSVDLRWQRPDEPNGISGKDCIPMRTAA